MVKLTEGIRTGKLIEIDYEGKTLRFVHPKSDCFKDPGDYSHLDTIWDDTQHKTLSIANREIFVAEGDRIKKYRIRSSKPEELVHLLYEVNCIPDSKMKKDFFMFRGDTADSFFIENRAFFDESGAYMVSDPYGERLSRKLFWKRDSGQWPLATSEKITERLKEDKNKTSEQGVVISHDKRIAFAPKETYTIGEIDPNNFAQNGLAIAISRGVENAKKLEYVLKKTNDRFKFIKTSIEIHPYNTVNYPLFSILNINSFNFCLEFTSSVRERFGPIPLAVIN
ncbi:Uncharacterised protein [uncultured archaeon]|nr:Uncharacterised protein [uncultured archaeon]